MTRSSPSLKTPLKQALGLGPSGTGMSHWWNQRWTALLLIPLTVWFLVGCLQSMRGGMPLEFLNHPLNATFMLLFLAAGFYHLWLGLESIVDDYVHSSSLHLFILMVLRSLCLLGFGMGTLSTLTLVLGGLTHGV